MNALHIGHGCCLHWPLLLFQVTMVECKNLSLVDCFFCVQPVGVDNTFRRKFDREEYLQRAREREEQVCSSLQISFFSLSFFLFEGTKFAPLFLHLSLHSVSFD